MRRAATVLCLLGLAMGAFALAPRIWLSLIAAFAAGVACLLANSATRALLIDMAGREYARSCPGGMGYRLGRQQADSLAR